jgi:hypothetical protein
MPEMFHALNKKEKISLDIYKNSATLLNMKETKMARYWVNQPSSLQPAHDYHGQNVIAPENMNDIDGPSVAVYFQNGPAISAIFPKLSLSRGWKKV